MNSLKTLAIVIAFHLPVLAESDTIFTEKRGMIVIETERGASKGGEGWKMGDELDDFTGGGYLEWTGKQYYGNQTKEPIKPISYFFEIKKAGIYQMKWRTRQHASVERSDANNDSFFRFASGKTPEGKVDFGIFSKVFIQSKDDWSWGTIGEPKHGQFVNEILREFDAGIHQIEIAARSPGHAIDRIVLYYTKRVDFDEKRFERAKEVLLERD